MGRFWGNRNPGSAEPGSRHQPEYRAAPLTKQTFGIRRSPSPVPGSGPRGSAKTGRLEASKTVTPEFTPPTWIRKAFPEVSVDLAMG
jgi:hypothetical protein